MLSRITKNTIEKYSSILLSGYINSKPMLLSSELKKYKFSSMQCVYQEIDWGVGGDFLHMERVKQAWGKPEPDP
jgi:hypothetical protein